MPAGTIVFSHANGFPAGTYRVLFEAWRAAGWRVEALHAFGHDERYPVTSNWPHLRAELIDYLVARVADGPAMLVGHSLGGLLSLMAAAERPDLARGVVMLDVPLVAGWRARGLQLLKASGLLHRAGPGRIAARRRRLWPSRAAVHAHFAAKAVFARWDPRVLADYVAAGFVEQPDGQFALGFAREIEARIYDALPHTLGTLLRRRPRCPVAVVAGRQSREMRQGGTAGARALAGERFVWTDGTHLFPMEHPDEAAALVLRLLDGMR